MIDLAAPLTDIAAYGVRDLMQRVRIGITGLAVVFLVVLLAAAVVGFHSKDSAGGNNASSAATNSSDAPADPLAELGVAPGGTAGSDSATQPASIKP